VCSCVVIPSSAMTTSKFSAPLSEVMAGVVVDTASGEY